LNELNALANFLFCVCDFFIKRHGTASTKHPKKRHWSMESGYGEHCQSLAAAESREEFEPADICNPQKGDVISVNDLGHLPKNTQQVELCHSSRPGSEEDVESRPHGCDDVMTSSTSVPQQHVHRKKQQKKLWNIVSSSDEEADTLKDRFWRNLEHGVLPEDLVDVDLYSTVCQH